MYEVFFYQSEKGDLPVKEFMKTLDEVTVASIWARVDLLKEQGPNMPRPLSGYVSPNIREIRARRARVFYFFAGKKIFLVHGIFKKDDELPKGDIATAEKRRLDWMRRNQ